MTPRWTWVVGSLSAALALLLFLFWAHPQLAQSLEEWTGETNPRQQLEGLVLLLRQRPVDTRDLEPVAFAGVNPYGANTFLEQEVEEGKLRRTLQMLQDAGVRWIHQQIPWDHIEVPSKGRYESPYGGSTWETYDRFINLAREYGIEMVARLDLPPTWAKQDNTVPQSPPDNYADYGDFVYTFAKRYRGKVKYLQIWNEPNLYSEWGSPVDARSYVELLKTAYLRAKEANPEAVILSAPLAQSLGTPDGLNQSDLTYLQAMYDAGAQPYFDILSAQAHGLWTGPGDRRTEESQTNISRLRLIREIMVRNGDASKAIWVSELGWDAVPPDFPLPATHGRVTDEQQARYTVAAYRRAQQEWPWIGVIFYWHFRRVHEVNRQEIDYFYRMVGVDFTPYPVYYAYQALVANPPLMYQGYHQENHWALSYKGAWEEATEPRAVLGKYRHSREGGATVSVSFVGSAVELVTATGPGGGRLYVEIDGSSSLANLLPRDEAGRAYVDLRSPGPQWEVRIPLAAGLQQGQHQLLLTVGTEGEQVVDGIIVYNAAERGQAVALGLLVLLGASVSLILLRQHRR